MNKKLIALAIAGACVAPAAMAQTANPVTLYGRVYVTLESMHRSSSMSDRWIIAESSDGVTDAPAGTMTPFRRLVGTTRPTRRSGGKNWNFARCYTGQAGSVG